MSIFLASYLPMHRTLSNLFFYPVTHLQSMATVYLPIFYVSSIYDAYYVSTHLLIYQPSILLFIHMSIIHYVSTHLVLYWSIYPPTHPSITQLKHKMFSRNVLKEAPLLSLRRWGKMCSRWRRSWQRVWRPRRGRLVGTDILYPPPLHPQTSVWCQKIPCPNCARPVWKLCRRHPSTAQSTATWMSPWSSDHWVG